MEQKITKKLDAILEENHGFLTRKQANEAGIGSSHLSAYVKKRNLERLAAGFYAKPLWIRDDYVLFQYRFPSFIYSRNTSLYLHGMGSAFPEKMEVTGPKNYRPLPYPISFVTVHTNADGDAYLLGIEETKTPFGNKVKAYDPERTICDLLRFPKSFEAETYREVIWEYFDSPRRNMKKLRRYAQALGVEDRLAEAIKEAADE